MDIGRELFNIKIIALNGTTEKTFPDAIRGFVSLYSSCEYHIFDNYFIYFMSGHPENKKNLI